MSDRVLYEVVEELRGESPPQGEERCSCGRPATMPIGWHRCRYCGGLDCGHYPEIDWMCETCFAQLEAV